MNILSLSIAGFLLIAIFLISRGKYFLLAAVVANFPLLSLFTYFQSKKPGNSALYLSVFSFIVSISFLFIYFFGSQNKYLNLLIVVAVWGVLSVIAFSILRHLGLR